MGIFLTPSLLSDEFVQTPDNLTLSGGEDPIKILIETYVGMHVYRDFEDYTIPIASIRYQNVTSCKKLKNKMRTNPNEEGKWLNSKVSFIMLVSTTLLLHSMVIDSNGVLRENTPPQGLP